MRMVKVSLATITLEKNCNGKTSKSNKIFMVVIFYSVILASHTFTITMFIT